MEPVAADSKMDPNKSEERSHSSPNLPRRSPVYTESILPQSMPTEGFSLPSGPYDSGSSRGHSPYEYGQPSYGHEPPRGPMYSSYDLPESGSNRRPSSGILPASSEGFSSSLGSGAFSALPPVEASGYFSPSPVYGYGSSTPDYSSPAYQDQYTSSSMNSGNPYQAPYVPGMPRESTYGIYPGSIGDIPPYTYGQHYPDRYPRGPGYGPPGGRYGGQRRARQNTSYASIPGPPIVLPGGAKGPDGANLFVFHIPNDFSNQEMYDLFAQHGNVLSARIMVESETGRSRGFGFVSYDSTDSAAHAIKMLNGYPIKGKRLKVQHKQIRGNEGPYESYSYYPTQSSMPHVPMQQYVGQSKSPLVQGQGYNLPTHLLGDESETSAILDSKPQSQESSESEKRGSRQHTPVLPPMPPQPSEEEDERYAEPHDAPGSQNDSSPSPLSDFKDLSKALPDP